MPQEEASQDQAADFETAIAACGFGLFNVILMVSAVLCLSAMVFSSTSMSFVMPTAECELKLSWLDKGIMNAVSYAGMIISAIPWGFMADTIGRRLVLIWGGCLNAIFVLCTAFSQDSIQLMIFKFLDGLVISGPFAVIVSYLAEFHGKKHRHFMMLFVGLSVCLGSLLLTVLAYLLLPIHIRFNVGKMHFHTWQIFLGVCALPSFLSGFLHIFLPDSPRFLLAQGNYAKALNSLQRVYAINKRKKRDTYPIKSLTDAAPDKNILQDAHKTISFRERLSNAKRIFSERLKQLSPICSRPYLGLSALLFSLHFCQIMCVNSVRLWLPQIFATLHTFEVQGLHDTSMCAVLAHASKLLRSSGIPKEECDTHQDPETYVNNIIVASIGVVGFLLTLPILRIRIVVNHILKVSLFISTILVASLYLSNSASTTLIIASFYLSIMGVCASTVIGMCVVEFPTLMRTMVLLLIMMFGRLGSVAGNILLACFMQLGCLAPFLWLTTLMTTAFIMSLFLKVDIQQSLN